MTWTVDQRHVGGTTYEYFSPRNNQQESPRPVVVLVHGLGLNRGQWQHQIDALLRTHDVLIYDLLAHGDSDHFPVEPEPTLRSFSKQLHALLQHLEIGRVDLVGFSLGGMIVRRFTMDYRAMVRAMVVMNSSHRRSPDAQKAIEARVAQTRIDGPASTVEAALERWFTEQYRRDNPDVMSLVRSWVLANDASVYPMSYNVLANGVEELCDITSPLDCPTLVMTAEYDSGSPAEMAYAIAAEINDAQVLVIPELKHMALFEAPAPINKALSNFLDNLV